MSGSIIDPISTAADVTPLLFPDGPPSHAAGSRVEPSAFQMRTGTNPAPTATLLPPYFLRTPSRSRESILHINYSVPPPEGVPHTAISRLHFPPVALVARRGLSQHVHREMRLGRLEPKPRGFSGTWWPEAAPIADQRAS